MIVVDDTPHLPHWLVLVAEVTAAGAGGHIFDSIPSWLGGGLAGLFVGVTLRLLDPTLRVLGERYGWKPKRVSQPPKDEAK